MYVYTEKKKRKPSPNNEKGVPGTGEGAGVPAMRPPRFALRQESLRKAVAKITLYMYY